MRGHRFVNFFGDSGLTPPAGFVFLVSAVDGAYLTSIDGAYLLGVA